MRMFKLSSVFLLACVVGLLAGCSHEKEPAPASRPTGHRIITFSPGLTCIVFDMGLGDQVVGVTRYCALPPGVVRPLLGDRLNLTGEALLQLDPDMIFVQQDPRQFEELRKFKADLRIEHFTLERLLDIPLAMRRIGELMNRPDLAKSAVERFVQRLREVTQSVHCLPRPTVLFVMGYERPVVAGPDTFVADMIDAAGGTNVGGAIEGYTRWRDASVEGILKAAPDVIVCQVEPGQEEAAKEFWNLLTELPAVQRHAVYVVTDRMWTIPGPGLTDLTAQLAKMIHPEALATSGPTSEPSEPATPPVESGQTQAGKPVPPMPAEPGSQPATASCPSTQQKGP